MIWVKLVPIVFHMLGYENDVNVCIELGWSMFNWNKWRMRLMQIMDCTDHF